MPIKQFSDKKQEYSMAIDLRSNVYKFKIVLASWDLKYMCMIYKLYEPLAE